MPVCADTVEDPAPWGLSFPICDTGLQGPLPVHQSGCEDSSVTVLCEL